MFHVDAGLWDTLFHIGSHRPGAGTPVPDPVSNLGPVLLAFDTATPFVTVALHDGEDVVAERRSEQRMKHGEQLAPLIEAVLADAGIVRQDLTAIAVGVGPGPVHRAAGRSGHRAHAGLRARDPGVRRVLARRARGRGRARGRRRSVRDFVVATDARRKEVYLASYDDRGAPARRARRGPTGGRGHRPARSPGRAACSTPRPSRDRRRPELPSAGWLARAVAEELAELRDPEPLYLRRPDAVAPAAPKRVS